MTVSEFIAAIGGNPSAARLFGVTRPAVCNWKAANRLPDRLHLKALKLAAERKLRFDPESPAQARKARRA